MATQESQVSGVSHPASPSPFQSPPAAAAMISILPLSSLVERSPRFPPKDVSPPPTFHIPLHLWLSAQNCCGFISPKSNVEHIRWNPCREPVAHHFGGPFIQQISAQH
eukprot:3548025-Pyramimonas_sp.AAC.1